MLVPPVYVAQMQKANLRADLHSAPLRAADQVVVVVMLVVVVLLLLLLPPPSLLPLRLTGWLVGSLLCPSRPTTSSSRPSYSS